MAYRRFLVSSDEVFDSCLVKDNGRLLKILSEEVASKLWSKVADFGVVVEGSDGVYVQAIKELEVRDGISLPHKVESSAVPL